MTDYMNLTDKEMIVLLHCRLTALERYIAAIHPQFHTVMSDWTDCELDNDLELNAAQLEKLKKLSAETKNSYNQHKG